MTKDQFKVETGLDVLQCAECSMSYAIPSKFREDRRRDHKTFYCPNGHSNYYPAKSDIELADEEAEGAPIRFTFDGGDGFVMPLTYETNPLWKWTTTDNGKTWTAVWECGWKGSDEGMERHLIRETTNGRK